jgi:PTH1 family peptidyl-tRNA hydrolase
MEQASLVVGLGNPGAEYVRTRHNAGFLVVERLAARWSAAWRKESRFKARMARADRDGQRVWFCQPQTYMNLSGEAVRKVMDYYQVPLVRLLLVVDDADLPLGELRMRPKGGCGGHHGLESVREHAGADYARLRVGIGRRAAAGRQLTGHVLGVFAPDELELLEKVLETAADQVECWVTAGINEAMNKFNGVIDGPGLKKEAE